MSCKCDQFGIADDSLPVQFLKSTEQTKFGQGDVGCIVQLRQLKPIGPLKAFLMQILFIDILCFTDRQLPGVFGALQQNAHGFRHCTAGRHRLQIASHLKLQLRAD